MPKVLNKYRDKRTPGAVYIGRPSKWGNPFTGDRDEVVVKHRQWFLSQPELMADARRELAGRDLICFCKPKACHGDILLEIANS